jgi:hypothetical protein
VRAVVGAYGPAVAAGVHCAGAGRDDRLDGDDESVGKRLVEVAARQLHDRFSEHEIA